MILAIDPGAKTGWAVATSRGPMTSGTENLTAKRHQGGGMRFIKFTRLLERLTREYPITEIYYEEVRHHAAVLAAHSYGGYQATLQAFCDNPDNPTPYQSVPVGTIKKHATGKGNAGKPAMIAAAIAKGWLPEDSKDDDQADALWIADYAANVLGAG